MLFQMISDSEFNADSIKNAFEKLAEHFTSLSLGRDSDLLVGGAIEINQCNENMIKKEGFVVFTSSDKKRISLDIKLIGGFIESYRPATELNCQETYTNIFISCGHSIRVAEKYDDILKMIKK